MISNVSDSKLCCHSINVKIETNFMNRGSCELAFVNITVTLLMPVTVIRCLFDGHEIGVFYL